MKSTMKRHLTAIVIVLVCTSLALANWPDWRGPSCQGHSDATGLPLHWSETKNIKVEIIERQDNTARFSDMVNPDKNLIPKLGILVIDLNAQVQQLLPPLRVKSGVVIAALSAQSPIGDAGGFQPGDVIHSVNRVSIKDVDALRSEIGKIRRGDSIVCQIERGGQLMFFAFELD